MEAATAPSSEQSLLDRLYCFARETPRQQVIVAADISLTYAQLARLVCLQADKLSELGIDKDATVGIQCADDTRHILLCLAVSQLGATSCTIPSYEPEPAREALATRLGVSHILDKGEVIDLGLATDQQQPKNLSAPCTDSRFLFSSSGTTGEPKLVIHHASDLVAQAHRHIDDSSERFICLASVEHNFAKRHRLYCLAQGATNIFVDANDEHFIERCQQLDVGVIHVSVFQAQQLLAKDSISTLSHIRLKLGGSHANQRLRETLRQGITRNLQAGYGTTETGAICFTDPSDTGAKDSVGQALPGIEINIVTADRQRLPAGEKGEIAIRCKGMFRGYRGKPELTESSLVDNWFYTGDIGYLDEQQRLYLCGRADDMFVFNSINIYPQDIEALLCQHPAVADAAVIPKPSSQHGNIPIALVAFKGAKPHQNELAKLKKFAHSKLGLRCPQQFMPVDEIPRNSSGKISRLAAQKVSVKGDEVRTAIVQNLYNSEVLDGVKAEIIQGFESGSRDIRLRDIHMDSIAQMNLLVMLEANYDRIIMPPQFARLNSLNELVAVVLSPQDQSLVAKESAASDHSLPDQTEVPYIVTFFRRVFHTCGTVAHLNRALASFEYRLTPLELTCLSQWHSSQQLFPKDTEQKFHIVFESWLESLQQMMATSGKQTPEPFVSKKIKPMLTHFTGPGVPSDKTLVICFSIARSRQMMIPNTVLMQHTDASNFDLLSVGAFSPDGFDFGVPLIGNNTLDIVDFLANLDLIQNYKSIRTVGCSAGAPIAVLLANRLNAEMAVSLGARFHRYHRHPLKIVKRFSAIHKGMRKRKHKQTKVIYSYSAGRMRDRHCAKLMRSLFGGIYLILKIDQRKISHTILDDLLTLHKLKGFLEQTIFADSPENAVSEHSTLSYPEAKLQRMR
ncbi:acyl--CoA ligase [bacterium SCSIO 12696]|nr:acyl--CoA ligase [bacterium SCSIO 12696]